MTKRGLFGKVCPRGKRRLFLLGLILGIAVFAILRLRNDPSTLPDYDPLACVPSPLPSELRVAVFGDTQPQWDNEKRELRWHPMAQVIRQQLIDRSPHLVLHTGDLLDVYDACRSGHKDAVPCMWRQFCDFYAPLMKQAAFLPCKGNHDYPGDSYERVFRVPAASGDRRYWSLTVGDCRFIALDSNYPQQLIAGGVQYQWLEQSLQTAKTAHVFVFFHHPLFTVGPSDSRELRESLHPLFASHADRIRAVFNGHDHLYYRCKRDGIHYFVTGGGGWYLSDVREEKMAKTPPDDRCGSFHHHLLLTVSPDRITLFCHRFDATCFDEVVLWRR